jgi:hypothetical protein
MPFLTPWTCISEPSLPVAFGNCIILDLESSRESQLYSTQKLMAKLNMLTQFCNHFFDPMCPTNRMIGLSGFLCLGFLPIATNQKLPVLPHSLSIMVSTIVYILILCNNRSCCIMMILRNMAQHFRRFPHKSKVRWPLLKPSKKGIWIDMVIYSYLPTRFDSWHGSIRERLWCAALQSHCTLHQWALLLSWPLL